MPSSSIAKLRSLLAQIGDSSADLVKAFDVSDWRIREHCDSIRQQVDIARETAIESIHKASNTLMSEIDAYERECLSRWTATKESTGCVVKDVNKHMREFVAEQHAFLLSVLVSFSSSTLLMTRQDRDIIFFINLWCVFK